MGERLDAMAGRKYTNQQGEEKTYWMKIGTLFIADDGKKSLKLDALPLPNDKGEVWISFFDQRDKRGPAKQAARQTTAAALDDEIGF